MALRQFAQDKNSHIYGCELDESRAVESQNRLNRVAFGSFFHSRISRESFHLMLINPPYLSVFTKNGSKTRREKRFLVDSFEHLMLGGVLVYIIPFYRLSEDIARVLCDNFSDLSVYRFIDREFGKFKQIAVIGTRQKRIDGSNFVSTLMHKVVTPDIIPELSELSAERYTIPNQTKEVAVFKGAVFNVAELAQQLSKSTSFDKLTKRTGTVQ